MSLARQGATEGLWLRAERQTAGRGRQGRHWVSPAGNLYASTLVRLTAGDPPAPTLALVAAIALAETVEAFGARPRIKWPNDLLLGDAKLSGILLERAEDAVVIGIGVNLAHHPKVPDRPTTSLSAAVGHAPEPDAFLATLADQFARWLYRWRSGGLPPIRAAWLDKAHPIGTPLTVRQADGGSLDGLFAGLDAGGALRLRLADGDIRVIHAGDIFLMRD